MFYGHVGGQGTSASVKILVLHVEIPFNVSSSAEIFLPMSLVLSEKMIRRSPVSISY